MNQYRRIPVSTYRLQFNSDFGFSDAAGIIGYLDDLGFTDIYSSPYFKARTGSMHGYDIVDPTSLNPEVGSFDELDMLVGELAKRDMGQLLDIVPNHMGIGHENALWMDLLENGPASAYADYFDVDWAPVKKELKNKVLLPVLGDHYGKVLESGDLRLRFHEGGFLISYLEHIFPVRTGSIAEILEFRMGALVAALPEGNENLSELNSIMTAISHLPPYTVTNAEKIRERYREKEIIKKRLWNLYNNSADIKEYIDSTVELINGFKANPNSFDRLDRIMRRQVYRLAYWQTATEEINYRRFFDINNLAAIRTENKAVAEYTHQLVFRLIREGRVTGLRVDHPDGLYDPAEYFRWLQQQCFENVRLWHLEKKDMEVGDSSDLSQPGNSFGDGLETMMNGDNLTKPFYIVGEKILTRGERMPDNWPIFSTTGYVFLNSLNGIFIDGTTGKAFDRIYSIFTGHANSFQEMACDKKRLIMHVAMASEINTLGHVLNRISEKDRHTRDFTLRSLIIAIIEVIAAFPVYRTYINQAGINDRDRRYIEHAISRARRNNPAVSSSIFDFLRDVLLLNYPDHLHEADRKEWMDFVMRFQQITGPVMAKGVEDTAFYVYNRFVSLNEVGGSPERFGIPLETFHGQNIERTKYWPHALITTATHDTKRGEDVRARLNVLSEIPDAWKDAVRRWSRMNKKKKPLVDGSPVPDRNSEYLFYQTLVGAWPLGIADKEEYLFFCKRIREYMLKAAREAKVSTSWTSPNRIYEDALMHFIGAVLEKKPDNLFPGDFAAFQKDISHFGMLNSLSQTLLKITCPGVPDFYQGTEIWDFSLVDPDNRRPVDFSTRKQMLQELKRRESAMTLCDLARQLTVSKEDGLVKLFLVRKALRYRRSRRELFDSGEYIPLEVMGSGGDNICAFSRRLGGAVAIIVAARFYTRLRTGDSGMPLGKEVWKDSELAVPFVKSGTNFRNILTGQSVSLRMSDDSAALWLSDVLADFPVALLEKTGHEEN